MKWIIGVVILLIIGVGAWSLLGKKEKASMLKDDSSKSGAETSQKLCGDWPENWPENLPLQGNLNIKSTSSYPNWFPEVPKKSSINVVAYVPDEGMSKSGRGTGTLFLCSNESVQNVADFYLNTPTDKWQTSGYYDARVTPTALYSTPKGSQIGSSSEILSTFIAPSGNQTLVIMSYVKP